jgi:hypothetical protein
MMALFSRKKTLTTNDQITIVSGLPRSGTSMLMKMLEAAGLKPLTDEIRKPDTDNPKGYYEFERVKKLETDKAWLPDARGRVVKIISMLLQHLPPDYAYKVIFIRRDIREVLASQKQMLIRRGEATDKVSDDEMAVMYESHLRRVESWLGSQPAFQVLYINHRDILTDPARAARTINQFLGGHLDTGKMSAVVDEGLYRQRKS